MTTLKQIKENNEINKEYSLVLLTKEIFRTSDGLNIFTLSDGKDTFRVTTFTPGKAAYENVVEGDVKQYSFKTKIFQGNLQGDLQNVNEVSQILVDKFKKDLEGDKQSKYAPKDETLLIETSRFSAMKKSMLDVSMQIRKAVIEKRPIHITHHGDCDGFSAGLLLEKAIISLISKHHPNERYLRQYIGRNPSKPPYYDMVDATKDIGFFLSNSKRFGVSSPLIIIVDNGSTKQDLQSIEKVKMYGADVLVIDHHDPGTLDEDGKSIICRHTLGHVNPHLHGFKDGLSASMLCYQIAYFINGDVKPLAFTAAAGGVADRCQGEEIDLFIKESSYDRDYLWKVAMMVDYEIYMTKMNLQAGGIYTLLDENETQRNKLISLYEPLVNEAHELVKKSLEKYATIKEWNGTKVALVNGDNMTLWGDYYTIGKLAGISFDLFEPTLVIVHTESMIVFRAQQESGFDVNKLLVSLKENITYARITGGGHAVAGSIKFLAAAKDEIMQYIETYVKK